MFSYQQRQNVQSVQTLQPQINKKQDTDEWNEGDQDTHSEYFQASSPAAHKQYDKLWAMVAGYLEWKEWQYW